MKNSKLTRTSTLGLVALMLSLWLPQNVSAGTLTWNGGYTGANGPTWNNGANWGGTAYAENSELIFAGTVQPDTYLGGNRSVASITFSNNAGLFVISLSTSSGAANLTFNNANTGIAIQANNVNAQTFGEFSDSGVVILQNHLTVTHEGKGALTFLRPVTGPFGITKNGRGSMLLYGANTYSGPTAVNAGKLVATTRATGGGAVTVSDGATFGVDRDTPFLNHTNLIPSLTVSSLTLGTTNGATFLVVLREGNSTNASMLVPVANIVFGGSDSNRTVAVTPATNQSGSALISIIVSDGSLSATNSFTLTVLPPGESVSVTNNTPGTLAWKCPPGVTHVEVECWGGGGASGSARNEGFTPVSAGGGGGAGGAYARRSLIPVTPGNSYALTIPEAAVAPDPAIAADGARVNGAAVSFVGDDGVTVTAAGGQGGATVILAAASHRSGLGGVGSSAGCVGDAGAIFAGGNGTQATIIGRGGAGGGDAGDANPGGNASETTPGVGGVSGGGNGGSGKSGNGPGNPAGAAGGGGGGWAQTPNSGSYFGASGALSQIILTYISAPNQPPVLATIENRALIAGQTLQVAAQATDSDIPAQTLNFSLVSPPSGASINPASGAFTWRPTIAQSPSSQAITVKVTDNGTPSLSAIRSFQVTVQKPATPVLTMNRSTNGIASLNLAADHGPDYRVEASTNLRDWQSIWTNGSTAPPYQFNDPEATNHNQRFYRVGMEP